MSEKEIYEYKIIVKTPDEIVESSTITGDVEELQIDLQTVRHVGSLETFAICLPDGVRSFPRGLLQMCDVRLQVTGGPETDFSKI